ncbi:MAG: B12-binding domain-containing radical SAM protein [Verrucomicrobia bacterium]|nr:B12-binding domain-containing radical SAM protein [Verrucomicrobiota bacterium]
MRILLVYPETPNTFWSFRHALRLVSRPAAFPPLGLLTIAAMLPRDWDLRLLDLNVEPLTDETLAGADFVFLSAMLVQRASVANVVARCKRLGTPIVAGGPLFTAMHAEFPDIQHFVLGEAEGVIPALVDDMRSRNVRACYQALDRPDITRLAVPRWDLVAPGNYHAMAVQFSRGCPYDCEFCDIVAMNGRVPRTKHPSQLVAEVEALRARGWRDGIFIVDDNFIGAEAKTKALLRELIRWRERTGTRISFLTETSVNLAQDGELLELMAAAGFGKVFVGIETPALESLAECHKLQNTRGDLLAAVQTIQRAGIEVMGGFIVGFDSDPRDIFARQFEFIQRSGVATAMVGLLTALPQTRLYKRLLGEGRIESESTGDNTGATLNFTPKLDKEFLLAGYRDLMRRLYDPQVYCQRIRVFLDHHRPRSGGARVSPREALAFVRSLWLLGLRNRGRWAFWRLFCTTLLRRPRQFHSAIELAIQGYHLRRVASSL